MKICSSSLQTVVCDACAGADEDDHCRSGTERRGLNSEVDAFGHDMAHRVTAHYLFMVNGADVPVVLGDLAGCGLGPHLELRLESDVK